MIPSHRVDSASIACLLKKKITEGGDLEPGTELIVVDNCVSSATYTCQGRELMIPPVACGTEPAQATIMLSTHEMSMTSGSEFSAGPGVASPHAVIVYSSVTKTLQMLYEASSVASAIAVSYNGSSHPSTMSFTITPGGATTAMSNISFQCSRGVAGLADMSYDDSDSHKICYNIGTECDHTFTLTFDTVLTTDASLIMVTFS